MRSSRALTLAATAGLAVAGQVAVVDGNDSFAARRLEMAKLATKLVYNKVGKAGSSELTNVILRVRERQGLGKPPRAGAFYPTAERLVARLETLSAGDVYMNHAAHVRTNDSTFGWINLVREPIDRAQSLFYYFVDPGSRKKHKAEASERARRNDTTCGAPPRSFRLIKSNVRLLPRRRRRAAHIGLLFSGQVAQGAAGDQSSDEPLQPAYGGETL